MSQIPEDPSRPSSKQLTYLRALAERTGQTFTPPKNKAQASREIRRLKEQKPMSSSERRVERETCKLDVEERDGRGRELSAIQDWEITGYGSNCQWSH